MSRLHLPAATFNATFATIRYGVALGKSDLRYVRHHLGRFRVLLQLGRVPPGWLHFSRSVETFALVHKVRRIGMRRLPPGCASKGANAVLIKEHQDHRHRAAVGHVSTRLFRVFVRADVEKCL